MMTARRLPRDLRRYEKQRVVVTLDNGTGVDGFLDGVYRDHVALVDASGLVTGADGKVIREPAKPGVDVVLKARIVRMQVISS